MKQPEGYIVLRQEHKVCRLYMDLNKRLNDDTKNLIQL